MIKYKFVTMQICKNISRKWIEKLLVVLTLTISLFFPILILYFASFVYSNIYSSTFIGEDHLAGISFPAKSFPIEALNKIELNSSNIETIIPNIGALANIEVDEKYYQHPLAFINKGYQSIIRIPIHTGRNFTMNELNSSEKKCILTSNALKDLDLNTGIGEYVTINNHKFELIGITKADLLQNYIVIPLSNAISLNLIAEEEDQTFFVRLKQHYNPETPQLLEADFYNKFQVEAIDVWSYSDFNEGMRQQVNIILVVLFLFSLLILFYSILNISSIIISEFKRLRKSISIKLSLGASKQLILMEYWIQYFILSFVATTVILIAMPFILHLINNTIGYNISVSIEVSLAVLAFPFLTSSALSAFIYKKLRNLDIKEVLYS
jgi:putative ABC transport system permease protein